MPNRKAHASHPRGHLKHARLTREAVVADRDRHVFVDKARVRPIAIEGRHFSASGALSAPVGPQGRPVIFQAGQSEDSKAFGARYADALFTGQRLIEPARKFYADVKALARSHSGDPDQLVVMPGLFPIVGSTEARPCGARPTSMPASTSRP